MTLLNAVFKQSNECLWITKEPFIPLSVHFVMAFSPFSLVKNEIYHSIQPILQKNIVYTFMKRGYEQYTDAFVLSAYGYIHVANAHKSQRHEILLKVIEERT